MLDSAASFLATSSILLFAASFLFIRENVTTVGRIRKAATATIRRSWGSLNLLNGFIFSSLFLHTKIFITLINHGIVLVIHFLYAILKQVVMHAIRYKEYK